MYIRTYQKEITPADVDEMARRLLASKAMHEREIELAQAAARALQPLRHYAKIDVRCIRKVESALADTTARISHTKKQAAWQQYPEHTHFTVRCGDRGPRERFAGVSVTVPLYASVADLITALERCETPRAWLARVTQQFAHLEEVLDAEEHIRRLVTEIEATRTRVAKEVLGTESNFWHDCLREHLPALTGER